MRAPARMISGRLIRPLGQRDFRLLTTGKTISYLGDWLMVAVLVGWVYRTTDSVAQVALLMLIRLLPPIVGGSLAASLVDRLPRLRVLVYSEAICALTIAGALAGVALDSRPVIYASVAICGLVAMISTVAGNSLIPATVPAEQLPAANAIHTAGQEAAMAAGALLGGITIATGGPLAGLAANLASYALAAYLYSCIDTTTPQPAAATKKHVGGRDGLRYICTNRPVAVVIAAIATVTLATGLANATLPRFTSNLGLGTGGYGIALAALATGMMIGEALTGAIAEHIHARSLAAGLLAMGALFAAFAWSTTPTEALLLFAAFGIANGFVEVAMLTAIHHHADTSHHGRVFGVGSTLWRTTTLGAVALAPAINALATPAQTLTVAAACLLIAGASVHVALPRSTGAQPATA